MPDVRAFQLYLLSKMRAEAEVGAALRHLGAAHEEMRNAAGELAAAGFETLGHPATLYRRAIGDEGIVELPPTPMEGLFLGSVRRRFHLDVWPELDFVVHEHPDGWAFDPVFVRAAGRTALVLASAQDLAPWRFVEEEVTVQFGKSRFLDGWGHARDFGYSVPSSSGAPPQPFLLHFDFGLLQAIAPE